MKKKPYQPSKEAAYWAEFYSQNDFGESSSFLEFLSDSHRIPETILDIGCGDGRDSFAFAKAGKTVIGIDRSKAGVEHATKRAESHQIDDRLVFEVCDVANQTAVSETIRKAREASEDRPVCFYMRFFLHSIPEDTQEKLLSTISASASAGDMFAAEFRTDKDKSQDKAFGNTHYRRYQNAEVFSQKLQEEYGWKPSFETEGQGLSPYKDEDPVLYRVIATKD